MAPEVDQRRGGIAIAYKGTKSTDFQFVQFFWVEATIKKGNEITRFKDDKVTITTNLGEVVFSSDEKNPMYYLDVNKTNKSPIYLGEGVLGGGHSDQGVILADYPAMIIQAVNNVAEAINAGQGTVVTATAHFDTFLVYLPEKRPVYKVSWDVASTSTDGKRATSFGKDVIGGTDKPSLTAGEKKALIARFKDQTVLKLD
ncbi:hypothetical protein AYO44_08135 [Planctomycetaceae bacterium SCGC AG-212-F19]|nr:hypothetical protein AYO44_08135 [Planctomycetaceae bacterium SCGC AG-212-F19]